MQAGKRSVTYAEGFAGAGVYEGGEPGSPIIAAEVFLRQREFLDAGRMVSMVLVEERADRLTRLRHEMDATLSRYGPPPAGLRPPVYRHGDHATMLLPALAEAGARDGPIFAFLDSFGGPDIPLETTRQIAAVPSSEVLVTFGTRFLIRFGEAQAHQREGDRIFGGAAWRRVGGLAPHEKKPFLVSAYRQSLERAGYRYVVSFEMLDEKGHDLHLVFGTSSRRGLERMKDAMWRVDKVRGVSYQDPRDPGQIPLFELDTPNIEPLIHALLGRLAHGQRTLADLKDHTLLETVYRPPHATTAVRRLLDRGTVTREPATGRLREETLISLSVPDGGSGSPRQGTLF
jgi:three-Cys-motif partner protein